MNRLILEGDSAERWHDCYGESWKGIIVPEAFSHPAKFSKALIERIVDHGLAKGYWHRGLTLPTSQELIVYLACLQPAGMQDGNASIVVLESATLPNGAQPAETGNYSDDGASEQLSAQNAPPAEHRSNTNRVRQKFTVLNNADMTVTGTLPSSDNVLSVEQYSKLDQTANTAPSVVSPNTTVEIITTQVVLTPPLSKNKTQELPAQNIGSGEVELESSITASNGNGSAGTSGKRLEDASRAAKTNRFKPTIQSHTESARSTNCLRHYVLDVTPALITILSNTCRNSSEATLVNSLRNLSSISLLISSEETRIEPSCVGDPFGGIGLGGIVCAYRGLRWIGCELEPRFVALAEQNFALHKWKLEHIGKPFPRIIQGDSRKFAENVDSILTSPPYADGCAHTGGNDLHPERMQGGKFHGVGLDGAISSPPYAAIASGAGGLNTRPTTKEGQQGGRNPKAASQDTDQRYGESAGQIARLKEGTVDGCITSPPFSAPNMQPCIGQGVRADMVAAGKQPENNYGATPGQIATLKPGAVDSVVTSPPYAHKSYGGGASQKLLKIRAEMGRSNDAPCMTGYKEGYGETPGNIGNDKGETYWEAVAAVYASCFAAMKPRGVFACVVKDYVSKGKRVPLCDDTLRLLQHVGFVPVERIHAMLVKETQTNGLNGEVFTERKERKSFFRRLAESKGSPPIDFEEVLFVRKPLTGK